MIHITVQAGHQCSINNKSVAVIIKTHHKRIHIISQATLIKASQQQLSSHHWLSHSSLTHIAVHQASTQLNTNNTLIAAATTATTIASVIAAALLKAVAP
jgi:hypothetical protein